MRSQLLEGMTEEEQRDVLARARRRSFARGEVVFHQGDPADTIHLISKGRFAAQAGTPMGEVVTFAILGIGEFFGELALLGPDARRTASVVALEEAETRSLLASDLARLRVTHPAATDALLRALVAEIERLSMRLVEALYVPAEKRILRRVSELTEIYDDGRPEVRIPLTQEHLAHLAGSSRATVNRVLREQEQLGRLRLERGRVVVLERDALRGQPGAH